MGTRKFVVPMPSTFLIVLPVFALIFTGWLVRRLGVMGPQAAGELNRFVVYLALPALLFDIVSGARLAEVWQPGFIASFGVGCVVVFSLTVVLRYYRGRRSLADAAVDGLAGAYANTGYIGFPLVLAALGPGAMAPTLIASIITVCAIFAVAIVLIEVGLQEEKRVGRMAGKVLLSLVKNPLLVAPVLGALFPLSGMEVPQAGHAFLKLLGGAASPCALVGLGLFLAEKREGSQGSPGEVALLMGLKLVLQPLVTWLLAAHVFHLPPLMERTAVLLAALPTGTGPFMLAEYYRREAGVTAKVIIGSTVVSVVTVTLYLALG